MPLGHKSRSYILPKKIDPFVSKWALRKARKGGCNADVNVLSMLAPMLALIRAIDEIVT